MTPETIQLVHILGTSIVTAGTTLAGGYKLIDFLIDKKLATLEHSLLIKINGTYVRTSECGLRMRVEDQQGAFFKQKLEELSEGMIHIQRRLDELANRQRRES